jgi:hypothetical protein
MSLRCFFGGVVILLVCLRPALRLPGEPEPAAVIGDAGEEASAILAALGWRRQADGSWLPPGRGPAKRGDVIACSVGRP